MWYYNFSLNLATQTKEQEGDKTGKLKRGISRIFGYVYIIFFHIKFNDICTEICIVITNYVCNKVMIMVSWCCRLNSKKMIGKRPNIAVAKTVSKARKFKFLNGNHIQELKNIQMKKRTFSKMSWGVNSYNEWRKARVANAYNESVFNANLEDLSNLNKEELEESLCHFVPEVTKSKGEGAYPGKMLYEMVVSIQKYLNVNKINWKLVDGPDFGTLRPVLDNVMKERALQHIGLVTKQAQVITYEYEEKLWNSGILGEDTPQKLRDTVLFLLGINLALRAGDEHYFLRRDTPDRKSQISFERDSAGIRCLVYREDCVTKTNSGGLNDMNKQRKIVWVYPSDNVNKCPVRLTDKYISLCPPYFRKANFYLQGLHKTNPAVWYGEQVLGINSIRKVVKNMLSSAEIDGYFTNHSLRRSGCTRLFQAGIDRKIVKEISGHRSDAVDKYQITSDIQKQQVSNVISKVSKVPHLVEQKTDFCEESNEIKTKDTIENVEVLSTFSLDGKERCKENIQPN